MHESRIRRSNMGKLREAARIALSNPVLLCIDIDRLMTLSLAPWQDRGKVEAFHGLYQVLGVFARIGQETHADVYRRLFEEAQFAGAVLGAADPG